MKLDPVLRDVLVCPDCKGQLAIDEDRDELTCTRCGLGYPVRDGIPVMLVAEARRPVPGPTVDEDGAGGGAADKDDTAGDAADEHDAGQVPGEGHGSAAEGPAGQRSRSADG